MNCLDEAAARLREAARTATPCPPVRDLIGADDVDAAYAVQGLLTSARLAAGARVVGRKIGLTSPAVQRQLGVDQPDTGVLFDDMHCPQALPVDCAGLLQPRIEAEVAFMLGHDVTDLTLAGVRGAVAYAAPALEIVDSRIAGWDIRIADTVADNASSGRFVLGDARVELAAFEPAQVTMALRVDGTVVSRGTGADCLGDPLAALLWLARTAQRLGEPLRAGQIVLSGALGPMVDVRPGMRVAATIEPLGDVGVTFGGQG